MHQYHHFLVMILKHMTTIHIHSIITVELPSDKLFDG